MNTRSRWKTSDPIVVYRETVQAKGGPFEGKSPNKHNKFYVEVEPLEKSITEAILKGDIVQAERIKDKKAVMATLQELGMDRDEAKGIEAVHGPNVLLDLTKYPVLE